MKKSRASSYPMPLEDAEELAAELSEFGYRETNDPNEADRRRFYKVERRDAAKQHVAMTCPGRARYSAQRRRAARAVATHCG
jgi:hypothetical protein